MTATMIPTRAVALDDLVEARDALQYKAMLLRRRARLYAGAEDRAKGPRLAMIVWGRATVCEQVADRIARAIRDRPMPPSVPGLHEEL